MSNYIVKNFSRKIHFQYDNKDYSAHTITDLYKGIIDLLKQNNSRFNKDNIICDFGTDFTYDSDDDEEDDDDNSDFTNKKVFSKSLTNRNVKAIINLSDRNSSSIIYCESHESLLQYYNSKQYTYRGAIGKDFEHSYKNKILLNRKELKPVYFMNFSLLPGVFIQKNNYKNVLLDTNNTLNVIVKITNQIWVDNNPPEVGAFHNEFRKGDPLYIIFPINDNLITKNILFQIKNNIIQPKEELSINSYDSYKYIGETTKILIINIEDFNKPLNFLPDNLEKLSIYSNKFNQSLDKLPVTLKELSIYSNKFNQSLDNLPVALKELSIESKEFNQSLDKLPINLDLFYISSRQFNKSLDNLPSNLDSLYINSYYFDKNLDSLPTNLSEIYIQSSIFNKPVNNIPTNLSVLIIKSKAFNQPLNNLPTNLHRLIIKTLAFNQPLNNLPTNLEILNIESKQFNQPKEKIQKNVKIKHNSFNYITHITLDTNV